MTASSRVAAVIVHYGDPEPTRRCLDSLDGIEEVVLVHQPSDSPGAAEESGALRTHPRVTHHIAPQTNVGFAAGCNLGVAAVRAPFVLLLNNDATLAPGAAGKLNTALLNLAPEVSGACLKLLCTDGKTLQSAAGLWFTRDGIGFPRGFAERDEGQYDATQPDHVGVPSGAAAVYRTAAWREAGGMSEEFFCYCEDGDLGLRMIAAGARFAWLADVAVHHELSASTGPHSLFKALHVERNHFATMVHSAPLGFLLALPFVTVARMARTLADAARGHGAGGGLVSETPPAQLAATLVRAWAQAVGMMPAAWMRRRALAQRHPEAAARVGRFLESRRVTPATFARSRKIEPLR